VADSAPATLLPDAGVAGRLPIVHRLRIPAPQSQYAEVEVTVPSEGRASVELMMPVWTPGFYRVEAVE
jgi:predicted metalloprotease with PDZ domain